MAISCARRSDRISSRFATFAQAISTTTTPTVMKASHTESVSRPLYLSLIGIAASRSVWLVSG